MTNVVTTITDVWAWEKYYKQAEVVQRIDVEILPTEATVILHQLNFSYSLTDNRRRQISKQSNTRKKRNQQMDFTIHNFLHQSTARNRAPIDELENQPGIFERKDLLTQVLKCLTWRQKRDLIV